MIQALGLAMALSNSEETLQLSFDELLNDFIIHINHFIDNIPDQGVHCGHSKDVEYREHHNFKVRLLRRGQRGYQCDELASHGP
jgi:hypothetical protein